MVFYRKYRPQTIAELDLDSVRNKLSAILRSSLETEDPRLSSKRTPSLRSSVPHAFLFSGPKGLGKTSAARILAKAINCKEKSKIKNQRSKIQSKSQKEKAKDVSNLESIEPCNECDACVSITNGSNLDVLEIDAASNRGIDEIRDLREKIKYAPVSLSYKIYIVDEAHMLTPEAFNALLKTLEEPPTHAIFILCTTEPWKLPETIVSRTLIVQFEKPTFLELFRSVDRILKGEGIILDDEAYKEIYHLSGGSFRDAAKIIEELSLVAQDKKITREVLNSSFKTSSIDREVINLLRYLAQKNVKEALLLIEELSKHGADFGIVVEKTVDYLRKLLLKKSGLPSDADDIENLDISSVQALAEYFSTAYKDLKYAVIPQLPLELVVVKWCVIDEAQSANRKTQNENSISIRSDLKEEKDVKRLDLIKTKNAPSNSSDQDFLKNLIEAVKKDNHSIAGVLRGCKLIEISDDKIQLETAYKFHKDKLDEKKAKEIIEKRAGEILGRKVVLNVEMKK